MLLLLHREKPRRCRRNDNGQNYGACTSRKLHDNRQIRRQKARREGQQHKTAHHSVITGRRNDDGEKHTVKSHRQSADYRGRQSVSCQYPQHSSARPARQGNYHCSVVIKRIQRIFPCCRNTEDFIRHIKAHKYAVPYGNIRRQLLADNTAHKHVSRIGYECHKRKLQIRRVRFNQSERRVLPC